MPENSTPKSRRSTGANPHSPFVFDVRQMQRHPGELRAFRRSVPAPTALGSELIAVPEGAPLELDVRLESVSEGVLVSGTVTGPVRGECGRCLDPIIDEVDEEIVELFAFADSETSETTTEDEIYRVDGDYIDIEPVVRDAVVLGLPWTPLCRPDCGGLCSECGQKLDDLPADHSHETLDPRWAALTDLKNDLFKTE
ncbi:DUF177 domain-containing protein [Jatrophihabitans sp.]|uniref:YceD family protein n=1 Tax=Jatrophihabitans sp. TaxID=1932789 RepID=UPI0030C6F8F2|nr:DNA-binding protein [Jatrophihabitans sp.]